MNTPVLSIIVPSYNMEAYLRRCVSSVVEAGQGDRIELLIVNDGSTDGTLRIAEELAAENPGVVKVIDKSNGHYGSCVNAGLRKATGRYVKVLDADDTVMTENLGALLDTMAAIDSDVVCAPHFILDNGIHTETWGLDIPLGKALDIDDVWNSRAAAGGWHQQLFYSLSLVRGYKQKENCLYTDMQWAFTPMMRARSIFGFDKPIYVYHRGRPGQSIDVEVHNSNYVDELRVDMALLDDYTNGEFSTERMKMRCEFILDRTLKTDYKHYILQALGDEQELADFDRELRDRHPQWYERMATARLTKHFPYYAIVGRWRANRSALTVRLARALFRATHKR